MSVSSVTRLSLLVVYGLCQIPCVLVPLFLGHLLLPAAHRYNRYVRSLLSPLSTGVYLLFFSIRLAVQFERVPKFNPKRARFLLMSHSSTLDFMVVTTAVWLVHDFIGGCVCIVKKELLSMPFIGWLQVAAGSVPVARSGDAEAAKRNLAIAEERVKEGYVLAGFPEGSRRRTPSCGRNQLLPFKKGIFHICNNVLTSSPAIQGVDFIPLVMVGGNSAWPSNYLLPIPESKVIVRVGEPVSSKPGESVDDLTTRVRTHMQDEIDKTGALGKNKEYSVDSAFRKSREINLVHEYGLEAFLMPLPMILTACLLVGGVL